MAFYLGKRSLRMIKGIHVDLKKIVKQAILSSSVDFTVLEGLRSLERQKILLRSGATSTMNSRHLTGHAVDLGAYVNGKVRWDWPLYYKIADVMKATADELDIPLEWGGDWKTFKDGPHFQLPWENYPA